MSLALSETAAALHCDERTLRRYAGLGLLRAERGKRRELRLPYSEEAYLRRHWELLHGLREALRTEPSVRFAVLFGSVATGEDLPESDVDLLVEHSTGNLEQIVELQRRLSARTGRPIHIVSLDDAEHSPPLLTDVLHDGRVIVDRSDAWKRLQGERVECGDGRAGGRCGANGDRMTGLVFRNVDASPDEPVSEWPVEAIQTALERGGLPHWRRLAAAIEEEPWGPVARRVEEVLGYSRPYGVAEAMERVIERAREATERAERDAVAKEVDTLVKVSGLTRAEFASRIGTSTSRLSTYATGKVTPSAALLMRMRNVAERQSPAGFASLAGAWRERVNIADDFDELPDDLAESLGMRP
jgi:predicted nucleotidyltransferase